MGTDQRPGIQTPRAERKAFTRGLIAGVILVVAVAVVWVGVYVFINWAYTEHPFFTGR